MTKGEVNILSEGIPNYCLDIFFKLDIMVHIKNKEIQVEKRKKEKIEKLLLTERRDRLRVNNHLIKSIRIEDIEEYAKIFLYMPPFPVKDKATMFRDICLKNPNKGVGETFRICRFVKENRKIGILSENDKYTATLNDALKWKEIKEKENRLSFILRVSRCSFSQIALMNLIGEEYERLILVNKNPNAL